MNKLIFLLILVVFGNCSEKQDILITKKSLHRYIKERDI